MEQIHIQSVLILMFPIHCYHFSTALILDLHYFAVLLPSFEKNHKNFSENCPGFQIRGIIHSPFNEFYVVSFADMVAGQWVLLILTRVFFRLACSSHGLAFVDSTFCRQHIICVIMTKPLIPPP